MRVLDEPSRYGPEAREGGSRADLVRGAVVAGGALLGGGTLLALPRLASSARSREQDVRVFNLVLLYEEMAAGFYREALRRGGLKGELGRFARTAGVHETAHVLFIRGALGTKARPRPELDFGTATSDPDEFTAAAIVLEDLGVAAYNGQAVNLTPGSLQEAARIVSVEARHAAWIRDIAGRPPAAHPTDTGMSERQIRDAIERTGFVR